MTILNKIVLITISQPMIFEVEFASGLLPTVENELKQLIQQQGRVLRSHRPDELQFTFEGEMTQLFSLRTVIAVYAVLQFDIPRPKALLGHENFHRLCNTINNLLNLDEYQSLYISVAGSESSVMMRVKEELSQALNLAIGDDEGDLLLRIRRTPNTKQGWDVLIRLTPRPLATREWRVCNYEGALNASIATAIVSMTNPTPDDYFLNVTCGSGTMLIERALATSATQILGFDISQQALNCAMKNLSATDNQSVSLIQADGIQLPFASGTFTKLVADLPFGQLVGTHDENEWLYPALLDEAGRVARLSARFIIITHEIKLMEQVIRQSTFWKLCEKPLKVTQSGLHPRIFVLERI